ARGIRRGGRAVCRSDRSPRPPFDPRSLHALGTTDVSVALSTLRRALRSARVRTERVPAGGLGAVRPPPSPPRSHRLLPPRAAATPRAASVGRLSARIRIG